MPVEILIKKAMFAVALQKKKKQCLSQPCVSHINTSSACELEAVIRRIKRKAAQRRLLSCSDISPVPNHNLPPETILCDRQLKRLARLNQMIHMLDESIACYE